MADRKAFPLVAGAVMELTVAPMSRNDNSPNIRDYSNDDNSYCFVKTKGRCRYKGYDSDTLAEGEFSEEDTWPYVDVTLNYGHRQWALENLNTGDRILVVGDLYYKRNGYEIKDDEGSTGFFEPVMKMTNVRQIGMAASRFVSDDRGSSNTNSTTRRRRNSGGDDSVATTTTRRRRGSSNEEQTEEVAESTGRRRRGGNTQTETVAESSGVIGRRRRSGGESSETADTESAAPSRRRRAVASHGDN